MNERDEELTWGLEMWSGQLSIIPEPFILNLNLVRHFGDNSLTIITILGEYRTGSLVMMKSAQVNHQNSPRFARDSCPPWDETNALKLQTRDMIQQIRPKNKGHELPASPIKPVTPMAKRDIFFPQENDSVGRGSVGNFRSFINHWPKELQKSRSKNTRVYQLLKLVQNFPSPSLIVFLLGGVGGSWTLKRDNNEEKHGVRNNYYCWWKKICTTWDLGCQGPCK